MVRPRLRRLEPMYDVLPTPGTLGAAIGIHVSTPTPGTRLTKPCACGSSITCEADAQSIELAVQTHQRQPEHVVWAVQQQLAGNHVAMQPISQLWRVQGGTRPA